MDSETSSYGSDDNTGPASTSAATKAEHGSQSPSGYVSKYAESNSSRWGNSDRSSVSDQDESRSVRKRRAAASLQDPRPFKRHQGFLSVDYLDLLNCEIEDAAQQVTSGLDIDLPESQVGLTHWSPVEKHVFFDAVARLGKHDLPGIAARLRTKGVVEVNQYIDFLQEALRLRQSGPYHTRFQLSDVPAAIELSPQCCRAQDEAADAISSRQENREQVREKHKWGRLWDITPEMALELDSSIKPNPAPRNSPPFTELFHLRRWLELQQRVFMNSSIQGENWFYIDVFAPSIWATALEDFHSLALSITKRLVQTALFISMSRIKSKKVRRPMTLNLVRKSDVRAAVASLGLSRDSRDFWTNSAKRLRLNVYEEPPTLLEPDWDPMSYNEVERKLGRTKPRREAQEVDDSESLNSDGDFESAAESEAVSDTQDSEDLEIDDDAQEIIHRSTIDLSRRAQEALRSRIGIERQQEQYAEHCDEFANYQAEIQMWNLLKLKPPMEIPKKQDPGTAHGSTRDVEHIYPTGRDWMDKLKYYSEWEVADNPALIES